MIFIATAINVNAIIKVRTVVIRYVAIMNNWATMIIIKAAITY